MAQPHFGNGYNKDGSVNTVASGLARIDCTGRSNFEGGGGGGGGQTLRMPNGVCVCVFMIVPICNI